MDNREKRKGDVVVTVCGRHCALTTAASTDHFWKYSICVCFAYLFEEGCCLLIALHAAVFHLFSGVASLSGHLSHVLHVHHDLLVCFHVVFFN